jgi:hypothetical protein
MKIQSIKIWRILIAVMLVAGFAATPATLALANSEGGNSHTYDVTFTKWVTSLPAHSPSLAGVSMAGVVGGAVGKGRYAGEVLSDDLSVPGFWLAHARYEFHGKKHTFIASVFVTEDDRPGPMAGTGVITGTIYDGWLEGATVTGGYKTFANCPIPTPGNVFGTVCFQGTLHLHQGENQ